MIDRKPAGYDRWTDEQWREWLTPRYEADKIIADVLAEHWLITRPVPKHGELR